MKLSARNALQGTVVALKEGVVMAEVTVDIGGGKHVVSSITLESSRSLGLEKGKKVTAIVKASNVLLGVD